MTRMVRLGTYRGRVRKLYPVLVLYDNPPFKQMNIVAVLEWRERGRLVDALDETFERETVCPVWNQEPIPGGVNVGDVRYTLHDTTRGVPLISDPQALVSRIVAAALAPKVAQYPGDSCDCRFLCTCVQNSD